MCGAEMADNSLFNDITESPNDVIESKDDVIEVIPCKDCRHANECHKSVQYTHNEQNTVTIGYTPIEWCSRGERREPKGFVADEWYRNTFKDGDAE